MVYLENYLCHIEVECLRGVMITPLTTIRSHCDLMMANKGYKINYQFSQLKIKLTNVQDKKNSQ